MLKSENVNNYRLVKAIAEVHIHGTYLEDYIVDVFFEHGSFGVKAWNEDGERNFRVVDSECALCQGEVDYCTNCGAHSGMALEEL